MQRTTFETLDVRRDKRVLRIRLNRPEVLNAIDGRMLAELRRALSVAGADPEVGAVAIDAAGDRAFCAGIDVAYVKDLKGFDIREVGRELHRTFLMLRTVRSRSWGS